MRKIAVFLMMLSLSVGTLRAFAQDATPTPEPAPSGQQVQIPLFIGIDIAGRAEAAAQTKDYQEAIAEYSLFLLLNPTNSAIYFERGYAYSQIADFDSALADFDHALSLPPLTDDLRGRIYAVRAGIYSMQQRDDLALSDLSAAI